PASRRVSNSTSARASNPPNSVASSSRASSICSSVGIFLCLASAALYELKIASGSAVSKYPTTILTPSPNFIVLPSMLRSIVYTLDSAREKRIPKFHSSSLLPILIDFIYLSSLEIYIIYVRELRALLGCYNSSSPISASPIVDEPVLGSFCAVFLCKFTERFDRVLYCIELCFRNGYWTRCGIRL